MCETSCDCNIKIYIFIGNSLRFCNLEKKCEGRRIIEIYFIFIMKLINVLMTARVMDKEFA